jgi:hypothetical protein
MRNAAIVYLWICECVLAAPVKKCDELAVLPFGADVKVESAKPVSAAPNLPEHCDVRGVIWPEARFALKLPTKLERPLRDGGRRRLGRHHQPGGDGRDRS